MKRLYESKLRKSIAMIVVTFICIIMETIIVHASEEVKVNTLYEITQDTNVYEQADENSTVISQLSQGTPVFCIEASNNGWTKIMYQDIEGYIPVSAIQQYGDVEEISEEFVEAGEENELRFERMGAVHGTEKVRKYLGNCYCIADSFDFYSRNCINSKEEQSQ